MVSFNFRSKEQEKSAINNIHDNLVKNDNEHTDATRKTFAIYTNDDSWLTKKPTKTETKKAVQTMKRETKKDLKKSWKKVREIEKQEGVPVRKRTKWKEFQKANVEKDENIQDVRELMDS